MTRAENEAGWVGAVDSVELSGGQVLTRESSKLLGRVCLMGLLTKVSIHCLFYLYIVLSGGFYSCKDLFPVGTLLCLCLLIGYTERRYGCTHSLLRSPFVNGWKATSVFILQILP